MTDILEQARQIVARKCQMTPICEPDIVFCWCREIAREILALAEPKWRPIETAPTDQTPIERWHVVWKCPISVYRNNGSFPAGLEWIECTKALAWPEDAFTPHWRPLSSPPPADGEKK